MTQPLVAVVTGASRGIGRATAIELGKRGAAVALLGRSNDALDRAAAAVRALGVPARAVSCDVRFEPSVRAAAADVLANLGTPRLVVNNAGVVRRGVPIQATPVDEWDEVIATNLRGSFLVVRALLPAMLAAGRGRFIQVASISSTMGCAGAASYAASKWGLVGFSKSLADELKGTGLQSIALMPGSVQTDMLTGSGFEPAMTAEDVARAIVQLGLDAPDAMTGAAVEMFG